MNRNEGNNIFDSKTIIAIILVGIVWFGWQKYLLQKYPKQNIQEQLHEEPGKNIVEKNSSLKASDSPPGDSRESQIQNQDQNHFVEKETVMKPQEQSVSEVIETVESDKFSFSISNYGMGIKKYFLKNFTDRNGSPVELGIYEGLENISLFQIRSLETQLPVIFNMERKGKHLFLGQASLGSVQIQREIEIDPEVYTFKNKLVLSNLNDQFKGISIVIPEKKHAQQKGGSSLMPSFETMELVIGHEGKVERLNLLDNKTNLDTSFPMIAMISLGTQYFSSAFVDKSEVFPELSVTEIRSNNQQTKENQNIMVQLLYKPKLNKDLTLNFIGYAGPKSLNILQGVDPHLSESVNLGFFSGIAKVLLNVLKWFYNIFGNWGIAIILLTILVRIIVLPFNISSYKSMKKMQKIQPHLQAIREKYKDNPQAQNSETMALMKVHKVNPLGGCLPMLLQMPVFFALYQVLGQSVELYKAPFFGWITDLSMKDPLYILPVLMGLSMWMQQKMTPSTMDPAQAKVMQFMPIVFSLMMIGLPSGLTLYIFVSTIFGILQQMLFMRDRKTAEIVKV